jgi:hypothetical protein
MPTPGRISFVVDENLLRLPRQSSPVQQPRTREATS